MITSWERNAFPVWHLKGKSIVFCEIASWFLTCYFTPTEQGAVKCPSALCHTILDPYGRGCEPKGYHPAGTASTRDRMFQALLFEAIGPFNGVAAESCLLRAALRALTHPHLTHAVGRVSGRICLFMLLKSQGALLEAQFAECPTQWLLELWTITSSELAAQ